jgi:tRNA A-37 threonylcarbamoyl transferase component Bud32
MKQNLHPEYQHLKTFVQRLPEVFDTEGVTIYKSRNELKTFESEGLVLNVKRYKKPNWVNQFVYAYIRKSKARRAYENALLLLSKKFETPFPVAYLERFKNGLLTDAFFISIQCPYSRLFREFTEDSGISGREHIVQAFGKLVARLHKEGILHLDLSVGNILFEETATGCNFSLVDLNRMKFKRIGQKLGCRNFERLRGSDAFFRLLTKVYAEERGFEPDTCFNLALKAKEKNVRHFQRKDTLKRLFSR